jgi:hypothetical protein
MERKPNTDRRGRHWTGEVILLFWAKGRKIPGRTAAVWRKDKCGMWMKFSEHGNRQSKYGWEIDHINPVSNGGRDDLGNLQPLNWVDNVNKGDLTRWECF